MIGYFSSRKWLDSRIEKGEEDKTFCNDMQTTVAQR